MVGFEMLNSMVMNVYYKEKRKGLMDWLPADGCGKG